MEKLIHFIDSNEHDFHTTEEDDVDGYLRRLGYDLDSSCSLWTHANKKGECDSMASAYRITNLTVDKPVMIIGIDHENRTAICASSEEDLYDYLRSCEWRKKTNPERDLLSEGEEWINDDGMTVSVHHLKAEGFYIFP